LGVIDPDKNENKILIESLDDIYKYSEEINEAIKHFSCFVQRSDRSKNQF
jgi:hypothetical protein